MDGMRQVRLSAIQTMENPNVKPYTGAPSWNLDKKVAEFKSLQNKGIIINDEGMTVEQWGNKWLELIQSGQGIQHIYDVPKRTEHIA